MCIIAVKPSTEKMFSDELIKTMFENNPNGAGLMFKNKEGKIHIEKGFMEVEPLLNYVHKNAKALAKTSVIMHFRISTSGKTDALTCHPYPVWSNNTSLSTDVEMAMAHNGMLDGFGYKGDDKVNDTQVFIKNCLRKLPHNFMYNKAIVKLISNGIGSNKLAFLDKNGYHCIGDFQKEGGYWFSNGSYKSRKSYLSYPTYTNYPLGEKKVKNEQGSLLNFSQYSKPLPTFDTLDDMDLDSIYIEPEDVASDIKTGKEKYKKHIQFGKKLKKDVFWKAKEAIAATTRYYDYKYYDDEYVYSFDYFNYIITRRKYKVGETFAH